MIENFLATKESGIEGVLFLGEIPTSELITGTALAAAIGLTAGTSINPDEGWLKWEIDGSTVLYSKKPYRHSVTWNHLSAANAVNGGRTITINGNVYTVSLPMGLNPKFTKNWIGGNDTEDTHDSEWNRLMYPIVINELKASQKGPNQANYPESELGVGQGTAGITWCREVSPGYSTRRIMRGSAGGVARMYHALASEVWSPYGWRPRLQLVGPA